MKSPLPWRGIDPTFLVVPPELLLRIEAEYGKRTRGGVISHRALQPLFDRYMHEPAFCAHLHAIAGRLNDIVFDPDSHEWGAWPEALEEIVGVAFILGVHLEAGIDHMLLELPEEELSFIEQECKERLLSLAEIMIDRLWETKQSEESWKGDEA
jgi:hypothetical protein